MSLSSQVALLEDELARLRAQSERRGAHEADLVRRAYRRGYRAGWGAKARGTELETAPERHARTYIRRLLAEDPS